MKGPSVCFPTQYWIWTHLTTTEVLVVWAWMGQLYASQVPQPTCWLKWLFPSHTGTLSNRMIAKFQCELNSPPQKMHVELVAFYVQLFMKGTTIWLRNSQYERNLPPQKCKLSDACKLKSNCDPIEPDQLLGPLFSVEVGTYWSESESG